MNTRKSYTILIIVICILAVALALYYYFYVRTPKGQNTLETTRLSNAEILSRLTASLDSQSVSDELSDIERDLDRTDFSGLDEGIR